MSWAIESCSKEKPEPHPNDGAAFAGAAVGATFGLLAMPKVMAAGFAIGGPFGATVAGVGLCFLKVALGASAGRKHGYTGVATGAAGGIIGEGIRRS